MSDATFDRSLLGSDATRLLEVLLERVNEIGRVQIPTTALLAASGLSSSAFRQARVELSDQSLLCVEPGHSPSGLRGANVYVLNMGALTSPSTSFREREPDQKGMDEMQLPSVTPDSEVAAPDGTSSPTRKSVWARLFRRTPAS